MSEPPRPTSSILRLVDHVLRGGIADDAPAGDLLADDLLVWLTETPRFRAFVDANRDKVRKKARGASSGSAILDLHAELHVAARLIADRRIDLSYEAYGAGRRGPDFTATYRAGRPFNIEVTRRRPGAPEATVAAPILSKLRQLPPSASNVLVVAIDGADGAPDPGPVVRSLRARADRRDDAPFASLGPDGAAAFRTGLPRLAAVVAWDASAAAGDRIAAWANAGARIPLPDATMRAVLAALAADAP